jgi:hypothetical protein
MGRRADSAVGIFRKSKLRVDMNALGNRECRDRQHYEECGYLAESFSLELAKLFHGEKTRPM